MIHIFSFLCNQDPSRSFTIAGHLMPVCQRCTGVYTGMGLTFLWLFVNHYHKKDLPSISIVYVNIICLLVMPIFGFHLLDPGPAWRLWSGLVYGNAIASLFLPATLIICNDKRNFFCIKDSPAISFWILFMFLNSIPLWFPVQSLWFYYTVLLLMLVGLLYVLFGVSAVIVSLIKACAKLAILKGIYYERSENKYNQL